MLRNARFLIVLLLAVSALSFSRIYAGSGAAPAQPGQGMKDADIKKLIEGLGHDIEEIKSVDDKPIYRIKESKGGWDFTIDLSVTNSRKNFWAVLHLSILPEEDKTPASAYRKFLEQNDLNGLSKYALTTGRQVMLKQNLDMRDLAPASVKKLIDSLVDDAIKDEKLWNSAKW